MDKNLIMLKDLVNWYNSLLLKNEGSMNMPISEGKFTVKEIVAHLCRWDEYLIKEGIPSLLENAKIDFPNINEYNQESAKLVKDTHFKEVIEKAINLRNNLVELFIQNEQFSSKVISINGQTKNPQTNEPFTFYYLIEDFNEHDQHHVKQVENFLYSLK
ncbi:DinB family protein [Bacillus sp. EAC]|uniref:DinB family protein n=1 Tax=Bacillus sp. EAC TaxID=1978338 RepID=UPI000B44D16D|nr:DinB family protein [Bacillus sp. EAC]